MVTQRRAKLLVELVGVVDDRQDGVFWLWRRPHPNVKQYASAPWLRYSISKRRSFPGSGWRMS
jgi:hypothetical protein